MAINQQTTPSRPFMKPLEQAPAAAQSVPAGQPFELTGAQIFLQALVDEGVETIFGLPGGVILPIYEYLPDYALEHILVRHEQGAVHMAEGYAKATGKAGVALVTSGPGATNAVTGIADAFYDSVPLVVFTGNVASNLLGNDAFQEADIAGMTRCCTKHNLVVRRIDQLAQAIREAFHIAATGRPGPVLVDIPKDVLTGKHHYDPSDRKIYLPGYANPEHFTDEELDTALAILKDAKQPVLLMGGGVITANASEKILTFAERFNLPVASSLMGLGGFPNEHPQYLGFCGMHGHYWSNIAIANADVLVIVGNRLGERQTGQTSRFAKNAKIIHIDLDPSTLEKNVNTFLPLQGCINNILDALLERTASQEALSAFEPSLYTRSDWYQTIDGYKHRKPAKNHQENLLTPELVIEQLFAHMPADAIVTTEVGQHQMWAAQRFNLSQPRSWLTSGGLGTMGFGFPAAIGAQKAFPNRLVIDIAGDGSFQMTLQEIATAVDYKLPVKVAIINNGHLGMIRQWQGKIYTRESQAIMTSPDYVKLAEAYGAKGFVVNHPSELDTVIQEAYAITDRPVIIDFRVQEKADVYPWVPAGGANDQQWVTSEDAAPAPNNQSKTNATNSISSNQNNNDTLHDCKTEPLKDGGYA